MYVYTWYQWLSFFFIYCFFGWVFESAYVSLKTRRFVNRGFLRLPMLPLYGTGAVMMLWVSLPVKDNLFLVYLAGVMAATLLEYVTGWGMEKLFKMKYWDYSSKRFQIKGYICLTSSIAWGGLTLFLTEAIHRPVEHYVLALPVLVNLVCVIVTAAIFAVDAVESVKAALDLAKVLDAMTHMRAELDDIQVQMALLKAETGERITEARDEAAAKLYRMKSGAASHAYALRDDTAERLNELVESTVDKMSGLMEDTAERVGDLVENTAGKVAKTAERLSGFTEDAAARVTATLNQRSGPGRRPEEEESVHGETLPEAPLEKRSWRGNIYDFHSHHEYDSQERKDRLSALSQRLASTAKRRRALADHMDYYRRSLLKGNPTASSSRFTDALKELREIAERKRH